MVGKWNFLPKWSLLGGHSSIFGRVTTASSSFWKASASQFWVLASLVPNKVTIKCGRHLSHEKRKKKRITFHYTGWLIGILIMVYYNPYIPGEYNPLYNPTNQGLFIAHLGQKLPWKHVCPWFLQEEIFGTTGWTPLIYLGQITMYFLNWNVFGAFWGVLAY